MLVRRLYREILTQTRALPKGEVKQALARTREAFHKNKFETDPEKV